jgi:gamma-glutamylcyclotransferase (GGCT)/AIG2-like uncharacterized protein YtfP
MPHPLFIYGTLHPDRAPAAIASTARLLEPAGRATIRGILYNFGEYPGVILSAEGDGSETVAGELFNIPEGPNAEAILARLDAYEDFHPSDPEASLFLRQRTLATLEGGESAGTQVACWVYTYNQRVS